jgi:two-component system sensor histidine kinase ChiS
MTFTKPQFVPALVGIAVALCGISVALWLGRVESRRYRQDVETHVLQQLGTIRAAVEGSLNERIYLTLGLRAYVASNPDITADQFARLAAALMEEGDGVRSVTLIKDNVISDVYPRKGNESVMGVSLLDIPAQRDDVLRAIESRRPWLSAPIDLVQGGEAFINRAPVFETPPGGAPGSGRYWGLVSILISKDVLLKDIVRDRHPDLRLAIRAKAADGSGNNYFFGDSSIDLARPLTLDVSLPTGDWQVAGVPVNGWPDRAPATPILQWLGVLASLCTGALTCMLLQSNRNYRAARITAENAVEQLSRKNESLEAFIRTASHDLRSPLRHIKMFSQLLANEARERLNDEDQVHISKIQAAIERMMQLLNSLLNFAKTGEEGIKPELFSLRSIAETVINQLPESERSRVQLGDLPDVFGDNRLLTQVLQNLIENGLKYNQSDDPQIHVAASSSGSEMVIAVTDNGIGMEAKQLKRIFEPNVRGVGASDFPGSGFGLAICERIVKAHGGRIWAESEPGLGSKFQFTLPMKRVGKQGKLHS